MLLACFPFSKPERMAGAWVSGFETNIFYENERASPTIFDKLRAPLQNPNATKHDLEYTALIISGPTPGPHVPIDGQLRVFQMDFVGRRGKCAVGPEHQVVVDKVLSRSLKGIYRP